MNRIKPSFSIYSAAILYAVVFDIFTKLVAYRLLPYREAISTPGGFLTLCVVMNTLPDAVRWDDIRRTLGLDYFNPVWNGVLTLLFALLLLWLRGKAWKKSHKVLIISGGVVAALILYSWPPSILAGMSEWDLRLLFFITMLSANVIFLNMARASWFKITFGMMIAGTAGNFASYFYSPYHPIDFAIITPFQDHTIWNFADFMVKGGAWMLWLSPVFLLGRWLARKIRRIIMLQNPMSGHKPREPEDKYAI